MPYLERADVPKIPYPGHGEEEIQSIIILKYLFKKLIKNSMIESLEKIKKSISKVILFGAGDLGKLAFMP